MTTYQARGEIPAKRHTQLWRGDRLLTEEVIGLDCSGAIFASGKTGQGVRDVLEAVARESHHLAQLPGHIPGPGATVRLTLEARSSTVVDLQP